VNRRSWKELDGTHPHSPCPCRAGRAARTGGALPWGGHGRQRTTRGQRVNASATQEVVFGDGATNQSNTANVNSTGDTVVNQDAVNQVYEITFIQGF
jgi:hypothetical protein